MGADVKSMLQLSFVFTGLGIYSRRAGDTRRLGFVLRMHRPASR